MVNLIKELLKTNNCVIVPGFGAFIANYTPAEVRLYEHKIYPPAKSIAFNRALQANDGLLVNAVVRHTGVTYDAAEATVAAFSKQCNDALSQHKSLILNGIGKWTLDAEGTIRFQSSLSENFLLNSFGLQPLDIQPVQRLKEAEPALQEAYQRLMHPEQLQDAVSPRRSKGKAAYWVTAFLAIAFLSSSVGWNLQKADAYRETASVLPVLHTAKAQKQIIAVAEQETTPLQTEPVAVQVVAEPAITLPVVPAVQESYIIIGAFFDESRALKLQEEAVAKGYTASVQRDTNNIFRVAVQTADSTVAATLQEVRQQLNARAWVYCSSCNF
jgi:nucleoid DNA-binding protein